MRMAAVGSSRLRLSVLLLLACAALLFFSSLAPPFSTSAPPSSADAQPLRIAVCISGVGMRTLLHVLRCLSQHCCSRRPGRVCSPSRMRALQARRAASARCACSLLPCGGTSFYLLLHMCASSC